MSTTVAAIAAEAFDGVAADLPDVVKTGTLSRAAVPSYNATTGAYSSGSATTSSCRVVDGSDKPAGDLFPGYVAGPGERPLYIEGATFIPIENDTLTIGSATYVVQKVADVAGAGTFFAVIAR